MDPIEEQQRILPSNNAQGSTNARGQPTRRTTARLLSSGRRGQSPIVSAGPAEEAIALLVGRLGLLAQSEAPRRQKRREKAPNVKTGTNAQQSKKEIDQENTTNEITLRL